MRMQRHRRHRDVSRAYTSMYMSLRYGTLEHILDNRRDTAQELELPRAWNRVSDRHILCCIFIEHGGATATLND